MISSKIFAYISTINLFIAILGFVKTQNYWYIPPVGICLFVCIVWSIIEYKISKQDIGLTEGLDRAIAETEKDLSQAKGYGSILALH